MLNTAVSMIVGIMLVLSLVSVASIPNAHGKILDSSRADLTLSVSIVEAQDNGQSTSKPAYATEGNFDRFYEDVGKIHNIFDTLLVPTVEDFLERHKSELANKYTDIVMIQYRSSANEICVGVASAQKCV